MTAALAILTVLISAATTIYSVCSSESAKDDARAQNARNEERAQQQQLIAQKQMEKKRLAAVQAAVSSKMIDTLAAERANNKEAKVRREAARYSSGTPAVASKPLNFRTLVTATDDGHIRLP